MLSLARGCLIMSLTSGALPLALPRRVFVLVQLTGMAATATHATLDSWRIS